MAVSFSTSYKAKAEIKLAEPNAVAHIFATFQVTSQKRNQL